MRTAMLFFCSILIGPLLAQQVSWEVETTLADNLNNRTSFEVLYHHDLPYENLIVKSSYTDQAIDLKNLIRNNPNLSAEELGELIFSANSIEDAFARFVSSSDHLLQLSRSEITSVIGTIFRGLLEKDGVDEGYLRSVVADFGRDASLESKLLFLQIFSDIAENVYDSSKLYQDWVWGDGLGRSSNKEMLAAMIDWLNGGKLESGVCYDTELMMNDLAPLLGLQGAIVLGNNRLGALHPEGLFFDTSNPRETIAILHDWDRIAVMKINSPKQLADALSEITGSHLLGRVLFDAKGHPLKLIHSSSELMTLQYLGHQELIETMRELLNDGLIKNDYLVKHSTMMAAVNYGDIRFEVREFKSLIADHNLFFILHYRPNTKEGEIWQRKHETELSFLQEGKGLLSDYYDHGSNQHNTIIFRHYERLQTRKLQMVKNMLSYALYSSLETVVGHYQHQEEGDYKPGVTLPIVETVSGGTLYLFDREENGIEFSLSPFASFDLFIPRDAGKLVGSISNYINAILKEAHLLGRVLVNLRGDRFFMIDIDYVYTNIDHQVSLGLGFSPYRGMLFSLFYKNGFTNNNFPIFYRQDDSIFGGTFSFDFERTHRDERYHVGLNLFFEIEPSINRTSFGTSFRLRY